jgi:hypothetical protein
MGRFYALSTWEGGTRPALDQPGGPRRWDVVKLPLTCKRGTRPAPDQPGGPRRRAGSTPSLPVREGPDQLLTSQEDPEDGVILRPLYL